MLKMHLLFFLNLNCKCIAMLVFHFFMTKTNQRLLGMSPSAVGRPILAITWIMLVYDFLMSLKIS